MNHQILLWFCGLRGAVCFCLGLQILQAVTFPAADRALIFGTTIVVIVTTVLVLGGTTPVMLAYLKLDSGPSQTAADANAHNKGHADDETNDDVEKFLNRDSDVPEQGMKPTLMRFLEFDHR